MVAWFVIAVGTLALFAYISFAGVQGVNTIGDAGSRVESVRRIEAAAVAIIARASAGDDGAQYLPLGSVGPSGYYTLPSDMANMSTLPTGQQIVYCPFGGEGATADANQNVRMPSGNTYAVGFTNKGGRSVVVGGRPAYAGTGDPNLLGFLIGPTRSGLNPAGCDQITANGSSYTLSGYIVRPLQRGTATEVARATQGEGSIYYVSPDGNGNGSSTVNPGNLTGALAYWRTHAVKEFKVVLTTGTYTMTPNALVASSMTDYVAKPMGSRLTFQGTGATNVKIQYASRSRVLIDSDITLDGVNLASEIVMDNHRLTMRSASTGKLTVINNSQVNASGVNGVYDPDGNDFVIDVKNGSKVTMTGGMMVLTYGPIPTGNQNGIRLWAGSSLTVNNGFNLIFQPAGTSTHNYDVLVDKGSDLNIEGATLTFNGYGMWSIHSSGRTTVIASTLNYQAGAWVGIQLDPDGDLTFQDSSITGSQRVANGIMDHYASGISGVNSRIYAINQCWGDNNGAIMFKYSAVGATPNKGGSQVGSDEPELANLPPNPNSGDLQMYQRARTRNIERNLLRARNSSVWDCN
jgi:hypothetical protein